MKTESLAKISVGDICDVCGMNRKSFYYHFKDKYDLVNWIFNNEFLESIQSSTLDTWEEGLRALCDYFADNIDFYQNALSVKGQNSFYEFFGESLSNLISKNIDPIFVDSEDHDFYIALYADAFRCVILRWVEEGANIPPDRFFRLLRNAIIGFAYRVVRENGDLPQEEAPPAQRI